jgi:anti-sigma B factor antagonist
VGLGIFVAAGEAGTVLTLSGEADLTTAGELSQALTAQLSGGARHLTVDISELRFADSASVRALVLAARTLHDRGGALVLLRPQPAVARTLELMGADQLATIRAGTEAEAEGA